MKNKKLKILLAAPRGFCAGVDRAIEIVKKIISTSIDKSKLDNLFERNLKESKIALKKIKS